MKANGFDGLSALYAGSPLPPGDTTGYDPPVDLGPISHPSPQDLLHLTFNAVEKEARYTAFLAREDSLSPLRRIISDSIFQDRPIIGSSFGEIPVNSSVSPSGGRIYQVPIPSAPGLHLVPAISLCYNSQAAQGLAGYGWDISGIPTITLINRNVYYHGVAKAANVYASDPVFALDGVPIVTNDDTNNNRQFPFKTASGHILVAPQTNSLGFVSGFTVLYPNGRKALFTTENNIPFHLPYYQATRIEDLEGNYMTLQYDIDPDQVGRRISRIRYGFNSSGQHLGEIIFTWQDSGDSSIRYYAGKELSHSKLLQRIESKGDGQTLYRYDLTYENREQTRLLTRIECSSGSQHLLPLNFFYGDQPYDSPRGAFLYEKDRHLTLGSGVDQLDSQSLIYVRGKFVRGSFNDGLLIRPARRVYGELMSNGKPVYGSPYPVSQEFMFAPSLTDYNDLDNSLIAGDGFQTIEAVDVDGDGVDELVKVIFGETTDTGTDLVLSIYKCNNTGHPILQYSRSVHLNGAISRQNPLRYCPYERFYRWGDFTAGGKAQLLVISPELNSCDAFQEARAVLIDIASGDKLFDTPFPYSGVYDMREGRVIALDLDSDSKVELCHASSLGMEVFRVSDAPQLVKDTTYTISFSSFFNAFDRALFPTDLNADGYPDFVLSPPVGSDSTRWRVCSFTGDGFAESVLNVTDKMDEDDQFLFIDINRDGLADLVKATESRLKIWKNTNGAAFDTLSLDLPPASDKWQIVPANVINYTGMSSLIRIDGRDIQEFACGSPAPELRHLTRATDSFGRTTFNSYAFLPERSLYWTDTLSFNTPAHYASRPLPVYVLESEESFYYSSPVGKRAARFHHSFHDAVLNNQGLGFCGFAKNRTRECTDTTARITDETHDPEKRGVTTLVEQRLSSVWNNPISVISQVYDDHATTYGKLNPRLIRSVSTDHLTGIQADSRYSYGAYDFLEAVRTDRTPKSNGNDTYDLHGWTYSHSAHPNRYLLGSVTRERVRRQRDSEGEVSWQEMDVTTFDNLMRPVTRKHFVGEFGVRPEFTVDSSMVAINAGGNASVNFVPDPVEEPIFPVIDPVDTTGWIILEGDNLVSETRWTYDVHGNVASEKTAPFGTSVFTGDTLVYDSQGRHLLSRTDALGRTTTFAGYDKFGNPASSTDHKGRTTSYTYDAWGRLVRTVRPDGTVKRDTIAWGGAGLYTVTRTATGSPESVTHYDALGREIRSGIKRFNGQWQYADREYDVRGRLYRVSLPYRGTAPLLWNVYAYDNYDRPVSVTEASGKISTWSYSGRNTTTVKDGITSTSTIDAFGDVTMVVDAGGTILYSLRDDGQPSHIMAPDSVFTTFRYDPYGRRERISDPSAGIRTAQWTWNSDGSSTVVSTNPNGSVTTHTDRFGRTTLVERSGAHSTAYTYGSDGLLLSMISDNGADRVFTYDAYDRVATETDSVACFTGTRWIRKTFTYGPGSVVSSIKYTSPDGDITTETYTYANGHNTGITLPDSTPVWSLVSENDLGAPTQILSGQVTREYGYTSTGLPTYRKMGNPVNGGLGSLQHFTYQFDPQTGNLLSRTDVNHNQAETFAYDALDRLVSINGRTVTYDNPTGNITAIGGVGTMTYGNASHPYQMTGMTPVADSLISFGTQRITYTSFDRPATIKEEADSVTFKYGCSGERVTMEETISLGFGELWNQTAYIGDRYECTWVSGDLFPGKEILYLGGDAYSAPMVYVKQGNGSWTLYNIGRDYLGSITQIATITGLPVTEYNYDPWGRLRNPQTLSIYGRGHEPALMLGRGFTGHEHLPQFGLINMNARLYDPLVGRFLSSDPYVQEPDFSQNFNRYSYALNNPLKYSDENGEFWHLIIGAAIGGFANWLANGYELSWEGIGYFAIGAIAGALSAGIGSGISSALPVAGVSSGGFWAGFLGTKTATTATSSFIAGALTGGGAGITGSFTTEFGNNLLKGQSFSSALWNGTKSGFQAGISSGLISGVLGGMSALIDNRRFWDGATVHRQTYTQTIPIIGQRGENNCVPASIESIDKSFGGCMTQEDIRSIMGGDPNKDPLDVLKTWSTYVEQTGHSLSIGDYTTDKSLLTLFSNIERGTRATLLLGNEASTVGHNVVVQSATLKVISKINGSKILKTSFKVMNPSSGGYIEPLIIDRINGLLYIK